MSTWRPPWSAQGQFKLTLLPATRASNSVMARRPLGPDRRPRYAPARGDPCTLRPARRSGLARQPTTRRPRWGRALRATPSQPSPNHRTQHRTRKDPGRRQPTRCDHSEPTGGYGEAEKRLPCLGGRTMRAWLCRWAMADAVPPVPDRWCAPSAKPELAPRTAAPPSSPGTTPLGAARSTKDRTGRR
jgi:hypothetical protein